MSKFSVRFALCLLAAAIFVAPAFAAEVMPLTTIAPDQAERVNQTAETYAWVTSFAPTEAIDYEVQVSAESLAALKADKPTTGPMWLGVGADADLTFYKGVKSQAHGDTVFSGNSVIWTASFRSPGATAVRLRLDDVKLSARAEIYAFGDHGHVYGPYTSGDVNDEAGVLWTNTIPGERISLQVHLPAKTVEKESQALFRVGQVSHIGDRYAFGVTDPSQEAFCPWNDTCITNKNCASIPSGVAPAEDGVAYLLYNIGSSTFLCSGGLLNDTTSSGTPFLLTANHCFDTSASAASLEAYFQWDVGCGSSCGSQFNPPGSVPVVNGSTLLATSSTTDFTLVQLNSAAPAGSTFLGWTTTPVANSGGTNLYRISHPSGSPQAYSEHSVNTTAGTCGTLPRGNFIYSDATLGDTEGGSSGSPVVNSSAQVVGQLFGACGASPSINCDNDDRTVDGAFAVTYNSISGFLTGSGGGGPTCSPRGTSCSTNSDCCSNRCRGWWIFKTCR
ncbi:MAG: trypsin-like peptidase domain-containing protein [Acidobacteriota bacterium]